MKVTQTLRSLKGNKVGAAIEELHRAENQLVEALLGLADQQKADHEVFHVARDLAGWSQEHVRRLAEVGRSHGLDLSSEPDEPGGVLATAKQKGSELMGRFHEPGLLLLADLRHLHRETAGVSLDWEVLLQTAKALKDTDLQEVAEDCHPETVRQMKWAEAKLKESAAQIMVTG